MSGTSVDGVDVALISTDGERVSAFGPTLTVPYTDDVRQVIRAAFAAEQPNPATVRAEHAVTQGHVAAVRLWSTTHGVSLPSLDVIGFHGQTITHRPEKRFTWQLGDGAALAQALGVPVVNDLRSADVMAGGQGAPLVPVFHAALVRDLPRPVAVVNVGGVANVTWVGESGIGADGLGEGGAGWGDALLAFDTGPGNGPIDDWCARRAGQRFDRDGVLAAAGRVDRARLGRWVEHRYFARTPPKSLDRGDFTDRWVDGLSVADGAATLTQATARSIAMAARHFPQQARQWIVTGGGARNLTLCRALAAETRAPVVTAATLGWDGDALEAQAFAFLAVRSLRGLPLTFPTTTGVPGPLCGGRRHLPA
jgi:anhydro-N-acetylmuramic acid kinase